MGVGVGCCVCVGIVVGIVVGVVVGDAVCVVAGVG